MGARLPRLDRGEVVTFIAQYYSTCASCFEDIEPGDDATYQDDEVVHADCVDDDWFEGD